MVATALNHMAVPHLGHEQLLRLARELGCVGVEFRNDLPGPLFGGDAPETVGAAARALGLRILALSEVKMFNDWSEARAEGAAALIAIAKACGAEAVSLIPRNDGRGCGNGERQANLRLALRELAPMLAEAGLLGYVEPLGFDICSLRFKAEVVETIEALGLAERFRLVHDTFHHHLAGGGPIFPQHTGIVHISGVTDPTLAVSEMRDEHRVLVNEADRLGNIAQIAALLEAGYRGPISYEPFSPLVHRLTDPGAAFAQSFDYIHSRLEHADA